MLIIGITICFVRIIITMFYYLSRVYVYGSLFMYFFLCYCAVPVIGLLADI